MNEQHLSRREIGEIIVALDQRKRLLEGLVDTRFAGDYERQALSAVESVAEKISSTYVDGGRVVYESNVYSKEGE